MFRNQYDSDVTVLSPQGRIHQVEYAMEAVKLGTATVGVKGKDFAVLVALKRSSSKLASYQKKIIEIDTKLGVSMSGITADARVLCRYMRQECLNHKFAFDTSYMPERLIAKVSNKMQTCTQRYDRRPYGVGLLVASWDKDQGANIFEICPSAQYISCKSMSIGSRSQSAKTYLEKHCDQFPSATHDQLIMHAIRALKDTLPSEVQLNEKNVSIAVVGKHQDFEILSEERNKEILDSVLPKNEGDSSSSGGAGPSRLDGGGPAAPLREPQPDEGQSGDPQVAGPAVEKR